MALQDNIGLYDVQVMQRLGVGLCQVFGQEIGLFLVVVFQAEPVSQPDYSPSYSRC